jgi:hypothetical protein
MAVFLNLQYGGHFKYGGCAVFLKFQGGGKFKYGGILWIYTRWRPLVSQ